MTIVRMSVAKSELMFSTPILAKMAVRAAKAADRSAQGSQVPKNPDCMGDLPKDLRSTAPPAALGLLGRRVGRDGGNDYRRRRRRLGQGFDLGWHRLRRGRDHRL